VGNIQLQAPALSYWEEDCNHVPDYSYDPRVANSARGALREELAYFCDRVLDGKEPQVITAIEAKRAVRVALALVESSRHDQDIELTEWD
ncbi:MAG TPA: hypothetical protein VG672_16535, partial [Bryobacteraceae bacterium]|nr:hypothetical protein [Bryobacteraceae bacterium]